MAAQDRFYCNLIAKRAINTLNQQQKTHRFKTDSHGNAGDGWGRMGADIKYYTGKTLSLEYVVEQQHLFSPQSDILNNLRYYLKEKLLIVVLQ